METSIKTSRRRRHRRKKRGKELKMSGAEFKCPSWHLGISKQVIRKRNGKKIKIKDQYLGSLIFSSLQHSQRLISLNQKKHKNVSEHKHWDDNMFEKTIDLCSAESSVDSSNSSVLLVPSFELRRRNDIIDLSKDSSDQNEIIDLTETLNTPKNTNISLEPTVIDISEDDSMDQANCKSENDEILVIGTYNKNPNLTETHKMASIIPLSNRWNNFSNLITCSEKLKRKYLMKQSLLDKIDNRNMSQFTEDLWRPKECLSKVGENIYVNSPVALPSSGLRPIIIDGSNVAFVHSNCNFSCKRLEICINYFKEKGHKVTAFVPQYRTNIHRSDDPQLLRRLERQGDVVLTPSKKVDGRNIVPYDDRFIVQTAVLKGGIIVTRDNYNDLLKENPAWAETIKYRTLAFTWVEDVLMFPKDPLGEYGPSLEEFLRFH